MEIKFVNPGFQYMLDSIMEFQSDDTSSFWNDSLFYFLKDDKSLLSKRKWWLYLSIFLYNDD